MFRGKQVRFEFAGDASTATAISIFDNDGVAITLGAKQALSILAVSLVLGLITQRVLLIDDRNDDGAVDAGERLWAAGSLVGGVSTTLNFNQTFPGEGQMCGTGRVPKIIATTSDAIILTGMGYIINV